MATMRITPDASLATKEAVQLRIEKLEKELKATINSTEIKQLSGRIRALKARLNGPAHAQNSAANPNLLISKNDLL